MYKREVLLTYIKHFLIIQSLNSDLWLEQWTPCAGWLLTAFPPVDSWMHVLVGCNIGNENNGTFRCTRGGSFFFSFSFFFPFWQKGSDAVSDRARWIASEMIIIPVLRLLLLYFLFFLFVCGCILRSLCCAIITDGCMLGPTKRNPNLIVFRKGSDHHNPKKMLHLFIFVCLFFEIICTVKVSSLKKALLVCYSQLAVGL